MEGTDQDTSCVISLAVMKDISFRS